MPTLSPENVKRAIEFMREYLAAPKGPEGRTPIENQHERDKLRVDLIESTLKPLLREFLTGKVNLAEFKSKIDSINKRNEHWGFKGAKGQMFFNLLLNVAEDENECAHEIQTAITVPENEEIARSRIKTFSSYVTRIGNAHVERGGSKHGRPRENSIPYFLSYFWQIQNREVWPVYYTNTVNTMSDMNLWTPTDDLSKDYIDYKHIHEELAQAFSKAAERSFNLYDVEHVFWFKGGNPYGESKPLPKEDFPHAANTPPKTEVPKEISKLLLLPDSYVPPIIAIIPRLARNEPDLESAAKASGTSLERALEKSVNAAFTVLGYETKLLGQGQGRVPDGQALNLDNSYAILWDAKARCDGYNMGTDDRTIREYVTTQSRELKRRRSLRNIYYVVVSSKFTDDFDDAIRTLKMETEVNEVCLMEADALVALVDARLREPQQITLGVDGVQRLFCSSGILSTTHVAETLG